MKPASAIQPLSPAPGDGADGRLPYVVRGPDEQEAGFEDDDDDLRTLINLSALSFILQ